MSKRCQDTTVRSLLYKALSGQWCPESKQNIDLQPSRPLNGAWKLSRGQLLLSHPVPQTMWVVGRWLQVVPTSWVTIDVLTHQVYSSHAGLNAPDKLKTEKNSKKI
jgi:hypothetical protein